MAEETTTNETPAKEKKPKLPREGPILKFIGPEGASKILVLFAALTIILQGNTAFWANGVNALPIPNGLSIFCGVMLWILGVILILMIGIIGFGIPTLKKIEIVEKYYNPIVIMLLGLLVLLFEILSLGNALLTPSIGIIGLIIGALLGAILLVIAAILEQTKEKQKMKPSKLVCLVGVIIAIIEAVVLFAIFPFTFQNYWDGVISIIVAILLLLSMYDRIKFIPYEWWMVLILGFILYGWVHPLVQFGTGGTIVLISFILMLIEK